jgi:hypothetical protein
MHTHYHLGGTQDLLLTREAIDQCVPRSDHLHHGVIRDAGVVDALDRFLQVRVESLAFRFDTHYPFLLEKLIELVLGQTHTLDNTLTAFRGGGVMQGALKVVLHSEQLGQEVLPCRPCSIGIGTFDALLKVFHVGARAKVLVVCGRGLRLRGGQLCCQCLNVILLRQALLRARGGRFKVPMGILNGLPCYIASLFVRLVSHLYPPLGE